MDRTAPAAPLRGLHHENPIPPGHAGAAHRRLSVSGLSSQNLGKDLQAASKFVLLLNALLGR
eukprot:4373217-Amphidinium_carterae.2